MVGSESGRSDNKMMGARLSERPIKGKVKIHQSPCSLFPCPFC